MRNKIKIIDLLCLISNGEEVPEKIKFDNILYTHSISGNDYFSYMTNEWLFRHIDTSVLNDEIEILDDEEDKDIPLIPDDDLYIINKKNGISEVNGTKYGTDKDTALNYNFKVLKEKINQVVEELNKRQ